MGARDQTETLRITVPHAYSTVHNRISSWEVRAEYQHLLNTMCTTPDHASRFEFPASHHAHELQSRIPQLLEADLHDLFSHIWARDTHSFDGPHYCLQVAFTILLIM
jgi:hypothetical protein